MKKTLWNKNFTIITAGTIISAFDQGLVSFALSLVVFDQTQSVFLSGVFSAITMIPMTIIPLLVAPYMDAHPRRPFIYGLDYVMSFLYIVFSLVSLQIGFNYSIYLVLSLGVTTIGSVYQCAYQSIYPDLIPEGFMQKGFAVSSMVYPLVTFLVTPISAIMYVAFGIEMLFFIQGILLFIAATLEKNIQLDETKLLKPNQQFSFKNYISQLQEGIDYLKEEVGVRSLYGYMAITNATTQGGSVVLIAFFQTSALLSTTMYSIYVAAQTLGRFIGGYVQYVQTIKKEQKYFIANIVYKLYNIAEMIIIFLPFSGMLITQFLLGMMGVTSMTLRESAVQLYLPVNKRSRVYSLLNITMSLMVMIFRILAGILATGLSYRSVFVLFALFGLVMNFILVDRNKSAIEKIVNVEC